MEREHDEVLAIGQLHQRAAKQGAVGRVKRPVRQCCRNAQRLHLPMILRKAGEIIQLEARVQRRRNDGDRPAILFDKGRSQGLVPADRVRQRPLRQGHVQPRANATGSRFAVGRPLPGEPLDEPQPLLGKREWNAAWRGGGRPEQLFQPRPLLGRRDGPDLGPALPWRERGRGEAFGIHGIHVGLILIAPSSALDPVWPA